MPQGYYLYIVKNSTIRLVLLFGAVTVTGIIVFQLYWLNLSYNRAANEFDRNVELALYRVAEKMASFNHREMPNENPVRQISPNYFIVDINDVIDAEILDHYLKSEFEFRNLRLDYEYAIYDCETDRMVFGHYTSADDPVTEEPNHFEKYDQFTYYFGILFPGKNSYLIRSMSFWWISAGILLLIVMFFTYSAYIILTQKRYSEIQKNFIHNVTHEFKTPVASLRIAAEVLQQEDIQTDRERLQEYTRIVEEQNLRLEELINRVMEADRLDHRPRKQNLESFRLIPLMERLAATFEPVITKRNGKLIRAFDCKDDRITGDRELTLTLFYNLVDNAIKYGGEPPEVKISLKDTPSGIIIQIADNGPGIPKKYRKRVFERYFRIPTGNRHNVKGFGLGLHMVRRIARLHKWKIRAEDHSPKGTIFTVEIPLPE
ncbi:MAG: HAMP domain-containing sensor histidine kinase [Bacteroidales bacterium]